MRHKLPNFTAGISATLGKVLTIPFTHYLLINNLYLTKLHHHLQPMRKVGKKVKMSLRLLVLVIPTVPSLVTGLPTIMLAVTFKQPVTTGRATLLTSTVPSKTAMAFLPSTTVQTSTCIRLYLFQQVLTPSRCSPTTVKVTQTIPSPTGTTRVVSRRMYISMHPSWRAKTQHQPLYVTSAS